MEDAMKYTYEEMPKVINYPKGTKIIKGNKSNINRGGRILNAY